MADVRSARVRLDPLVLSNNWARKTEGTRQAAGCGPGNRPTDLPVSVAPARNGRGADSDRGPPSE